MCEWIIAKSPNKRILMSSIFSSVKRSRNGYHLQELFLVAQQKVRQGKHEVLSQYLPVTLHVAILIRRQIVGIELHQNLEVFLSLLVSFISYLLALVQYDGNG